MPYRIPMYNERKAAQIAAFMLAKEGGRMPHLKLMKLLYLAEREALNLFGMPMIGDRIVAMPHGPVLSMTLNLMDGDVESVEGGWESWISDKENHELSVIGEVTPGSLDELSAADIDVLESTWLRFGHMTKWQIRDYTHKHCTEWADPHGSSVPISYEEVFEALGRTCGQAMEMAAHIESERTIDRLFAAL